MPNFGDLTAKPQIPFRSLLTGGWAPEFKSPPQQMNEEGQITGGGMWSASPIGRAVDVGRSEGSLAGLADLSKMAMRTRGGVSEPDFSGLIKSIRGIARKFTNDPSRQDDLAQTGFQTILERGKDAMQKPTIMAKQGMINSLKADSPGGVRDINATRMSRAQAAAEQALGQSAGNANEMMIYHKYRDQLPSAELKDFNLTKFRKIREATPDRTISLETPRDETHTIGDTIPGGDDPSKIAEMSQRFRTLTPDQRVNVQKIVEGLDVHPQVKARILQKLQTEGGPQPISGGSGEGRPLPPGAYSTQQIFNTPMYLKSGSEVGDPTSGARAITTRRLMETPTARDSFISGNPSSPPPTVLHQSPMDIMKRTPYVGVEDYTPGAGTDMGPTSTYPGYRSNMEETLPPGMKPGATIFELIKKVQQGIASMGRN